MALKSLATCVGALVLLTPFFGTPGICGLTGGIMAKLFPTSDFVGISGVVLFFATLLCAAISIVWLIIALIVYGIRAARAQERDISRKTP
ncbi:hypothetical protein ACFQBQ_17710 [Granulicella cerasi]|uniref:Uncharacterized protein n=2 Tax=Granulicella cerasi TaxID=741063 RepID=A0ABW1ZE65_9BACT